MKPRSPRIALLSGLAVLLLTGCGARSGVTSSEGSGTQVTASSGLESVIFGALEVREHQRLAYDLYDRFARIHADATFRAARDLRRSNIDSLGRMLRNRDTFDAGPMLPPGQYDDPALQAEFDRLSRLGAESPLAAARVGALLEERDHALLKAQTRETSATDVTRLYTRMQRTSRAQLYTFVTRLRTQGELYAPRHMQTADFQALLDTRPPQEANH
jgi:hypothetical protein